METYNGHVRSPNDAILLFEACRIGLLPRVQRRLSEKERQQIKSGSVFVWDEREAGMRRWTDGKSWSASRVSGSFLTYREMEGKRGATQALSQAAAAASAPKRASAKSPDGSATGDSDGEGLDGYRYKPDGLMKQSFSITTSSGQHLHLISYYSRSQNAPLLQQPSNDPQLRHIRPPKNMYPESTQANEAQPGPAVTRSPMQGSPYTSAPQQLGPGSPYSRPGPAQQFYMPVAAYPPTPPNGTPPYPYAYFPPGQAIPYGAHIIYPYQAAQPHLLDRGPPGIGSNGIPHPHPHPHANHHPLMGAHTAYASHASPVHYMGHPPARPMPPAEQSPHTSQPPNRLPPAPVSMLPEQGPQLPAINTATPANASKSTTPQPSDPRAQDSLSLPEANGTASKNEPSPARTVPSLSSILNGGPKSNGNEVNSGRSGSRSPNEAQRPVRELSAFKLASNSTNTDAVAVSKLNKVSLTS